MQIASQSEEVISQEEPEVVLEESGDITEVIPEEYTEYEMEVLNQLIVTNEYLSQISFLQLFIFAFLIFEFVYRLIRFNITNHFS